MRRRPRVSLCTRNCGGGVAMTAPNTQIALAGDAHGDPDPAVAAVVSAIGRHVSDAVATADIYGDFVEGPHDCVLGPRKERFAPGDFGEIAQHARIASSSPVPLRARDGVDNRVVGTSAIEHLVFIVEARVVFTV